MLILKIVAGVLVGLWVLVWLVRRFAARAAAVGPPRTAAAEVGPMAPPEVEEALFGDAHLRELAALWNSPAIDREPTDGARPPAAPVDTSGGVRLAYSAMVDPEHGGAILSYVSLSNAHGHLRPETCLALVAFLLRISGVDLNAIGYAQRMRAAFHVAWVLPPPAHAAFAGATTAPTDSAIRSAASEARAWARRKLA